MSEGHTWNLDPGEKETIIEVFAFYIDVTWDDIRDADLLMDVDLIRRWKKVMRFFHTITGEWRCNGSNMDEKPALYIELGGR